MKTFLAKKDEVEKKWVVLDATGKSLGRVASRVASIIRGKTKPTYTPHVDTGDNVIIINAAKIKLSGAKMEQKVYYRHSGFPGGIKSATAQQIFQNKPANLLKKAVYGMLPKTRLGRTLKSNLRVYDDGEHPHAPQKPELITL